ncbi:MAG: 3-isopropylmalate dehydrogenase, partial [Lentisphaeria bacterium]|nr:3-isopropylmalate dehydrogenase [Lentisphaeria bacterium]
QILSVAMLFEHFNCHAEGKMIRQAVNDSLEANIRTADVQTPGVAPCTTTQVGEWITNRIKELTE